MRLATLARPDGSTFAARQTRTGVIPLAADSLDVLLREPDWPSAAHHATGTALPVDRFAFAAPVSAPSKVICVGHNYRAHIREMGRPMPEHPTLFTKFANTLTGPFATIELPPESNQVDWEGELAVVVGAPIRRAGRHQAHAAVAGYTIANDLSMRDWQNRTGQWLQGKAFEGTTPLGPVLVTADEFTPSGAMLRTRVNGETVQESSLGDLLFDVPALLSYISTFTTLHPGDVVLTGTPAGVGAAHTPQRFLVAGDVLETEIEGIGTLRNQMIRGS